MDWDNMNAFLNVKELAKFLNIGTAAAYNLVRKEGFPVMRIGRQLRISKDGLREWTKTQRG